MLGKTHIALGVASALIITRPDTVSGLVTAVTAGAIGGYIVDIDIKNRDIEYDELKKRETIYDNIINALFIGAFILIDFLIGNGMCQYIVDNWSWSIWVALALLLALLIIGYNTKHRTFTHSFLALILFSAVMYFICRPAAIPFLIGYASHIVVDFFNKKGEQLFFPSNGSLVQNYGILTRKENTIIFIVAFALSMITGAILLVRAISVKDGSAFLVKLQKISCGG